MSEERFNLRMMRDEADNSLDVVLDQALRSYASVAPREGFEGRILARIDADLRERHERSFRFGLPVLSGAALACVALTLVFVLLPGKKEIGKVGQTIPTQKLLEPAHGTKVHDAAPARVRVKLRSAVVLQKDKSNFEEEQERLIRQLMANGPEAIRSLARMDEEEDAAEKQGEPVKIAPIKFERIQIEPLDSTDNPTATETNSLDGASE